MYSLISHNIKIEWSWKGSGGIIVLSDFHPWCKECKKHKDLNVTQTTEEIKHYSKSYLNILRSHSNAVARDLLGFEVHKRLRKTYTLHYFLQFRKILNSKIQVMNSEFHFMNSEFQLNIINLLGIKLRFFYE